jgi:hypothetical protein
MGMGKQHKWIKSFMLIMMCSMFFLAACTSKDTATETKKEESKKEEVKEEKLDGKEVLQKMNKVLAELDSVSMKVKMSAGVIPMMQFEMKAHKKPQEAVSIIVHDPEVGEIHGIFANNVLYVKTSDMPKWEQLPPENEVAVELRQVMAPENWAETYDEEFMNTVDSIEVKREGDDYVLRMKMNPDKYALLVEKKEGVSLKINTATAVITVDSKTYFPKKAIANLETDEQGIKVPVVMETEYDSINAVEEIKAPK